MEANPHKKKSVIKWIGLGVAILFLCYFVIFPVATDISYCFTIRQWDALSSDAISSGRFDTSKIHSVEIYKVIIPTWRFRSKYMGEPSSVLRTVAEIEDMLQVLRASRPSKGDFFGDGDIKRPCPGVVLVFNFRRSTPAAMLELNPYYKGGKITSLYVRSASYPDEMGAHGYPAGSRLLKWVNEKKLL